MLTMVMVSLLVFTLGLSAAGDADKSKGKTKTARTGEICITFDELPVANTFAEVDREAVTERLLAALEKHEVKAAGFVVGNRIEDGYDILGAWLNKGHVLGNLTFSHQDLHELGPDGFAVDVIAGERALETMLEGFGQKKRYFRYPFLHYGNTIEAKREIGRYLAGKGVEVVHATVIVEDYFYNLSLEKSGDDIDSASFVGLRDDYLNHVLEELNRSELLAREVLKRDCRHILLLRANLLNSFFLDDLLTALEDEGYKFISVDRALQDKLYEAPEAYFGTRGVGYIEMLRNSAVDLLPAE